KTAVCVFVGAQADKCAVPAELFACVVKLVVLRWIYVLHIVWHLRGVLPSGKPFGVRVRQGSFDDILGGSDKRFCLRQHPFLMTEVRRRRWRYGAYQMQHNR